MTARVITGKAVSHKEGVLLQSDDEGNVTLQQGLSSDTRLTFTESQFIQLSELAQNMIEWK